jgi:DNA/RNA endonuclease YhcR with UshA esterase domain
MNRRCAVSLFLLAFFVLGSSAAFAHHGTANYDTTKSVTVKGAVTNFQFINPHVIISLEVKDDKGVVQNWQGGLTSPNHLMRSGWTKDTLKPGDVITISGFPAKSGAPEMWIQKVVLASGEVLDTSGGN